VDIPLQTIEYPSPVFIAEAEYCLPVFILMSIDGKTLTRSYTYYQLLVCLSVIHMMTVLTKCLYTVNPIAKVVYENNRHCSSWID
jgi:hypothetical protein